MRAAGREEPQGGPESIRSPAVRSPGAAAARSALHTVGWALPKSGGSRIYRSVTLIGHPFSVTVFVWGLHVHSRFPALASLALAIALCGSGCGETRGHGRVLLIGIDGATLRVAKPMLDRGELPNLERIAASGAFGPLQSHFPLTSPRIWASIATGKLPDKHGILSFAKEDADGQRHLYRSSDRTAHALWNIVSDAGLEVAVVNWWTTYPIEKVNGVIVSDHLLPQELKGRRGLAKIDVQFDGAIAEPPEWGERALALRDVDEPLTDVPDPFADPSIFPEWILPERLSQRYRNDQAVARIATAIDRERRPDLLMVFLPGIDRVSHRLWAGIEPADAYPGPLGLSDAQKTAMDDALHQYYRYTDALIGEISSDFGPDDLVLVVSDHGFEAGHKMWVLTGVHDSERALYGVFFARGPHVSVPNRPRVVSVNDIAPTVLRWLGIPVGEDMDGRPAAFLDLPAEPMVATHDGTPIEYVDSGASGVEQKILDQLEKLGYFDGGRDAPAAPAPPTAVPPAPPPPTAP